MKFSKLTLAVATLVGAGITSEAYAIDLYVDNKTKQIYAEPGPGRERMGSFVQVEEAAAKPADTAELSEVREDLELKSMEIKALQEHMTEAEQGSKVKIDKKGVQFESADKDFKFKLGGRIHADSSFSSGDDYLDDGDHAEANDGTEIRRARMRFEGVFFRDWRFRTEADFANNDVSMKDVFLQYLGLNFMTITVGQQKQNFSHELQASSNNLMFTERSLMNVLNAPTVDRAIGLNFESFGKNYVAKVGVYGDSISPARTGSDPEIANAGDEGWGISSRLVYNPILEKTRLIHLGVAGNYRTPDDTGDVAIARQLRYQYETTNMSNLDLVDTRISNVDDIKMLGLEGAGMYGPFSVGAEYTRTWLDRKNVTEDSNLEFDGWYAEAGWSLTGESRGYKEGEFRYLTPAKPFSLKNHTWGAWEVATRYSEVDLNDGGFQGGNLSNITVALNWYINTNVRLMANYTRLLDIESSPLTTPTGAALTGDNASLDTYMLRAQVAF